jgi:hypothetical protein
MKHRVKVTKVSEAGKNPAPKKPKTLIMKLVALEWERRLKKAAQGQKATTWSNP